MKQWTDNCMVVIGVDDVHARYPRASEIAASAVFKEMKIKPVESVGASEILHVFDPSAGLLEFVQ